MVRMLLEQGIDQNLQPTPGYTALYISQYHYDTEKKKWFGNWEKYKKVIDVLNEFKQKELTAQRTLEN